MDPQDIDNLAVQDHITQISIINKHDFVTIKEWEDERQYRANQIIFYFTEIINNLDVYLVDHFENRKYIIEIIQVRLLSVFSRNIFYFLKI